MNIWKAHYIDKLHNEDIDIINDTGSESPLSFTIEGMTFSGMDLSDFELVSGEKYSEAKEKFCILKMGPYRTQNGAWNYYYLQRYTMKIDIPVHVIRKADKQDIEGILHIEFELVEPDNEKADFDEIILHDFTLYVEGKSYSCQDKNFWFEDRLKEIGKMIEESYYLMCCFTCQFSDYSPYGNDDFGNMLCYRANKAEYLKVNNKEEYFRYVGDLDAYTVQETGLCSEYEIRNRSDGYRGYVGVEKYI
ncbi:MAG: DUF6304 family protein [Clostridia bacterium]|nr:DUF6304 family protein [Clostridia bacterium]